MFTMRLPFTLELLHLLNCHTKYEDVVCTDFFPHLNVGTIQCSNGQCSIGHELHVTSP